MKYFVSILALGALFAVAPLLAHHSFAAEYDAKKPFEMKGVITKVDWMNPHVYFFIDVKDPETGRVANWSFEMAAPGALKNSGWTRNTLHTGDLIIVEGTRAKDGGLHGNARSVTLASTGQKLGAASSETKGN